jgi:hypothetical protein
VTFPNSYFNIFEDELLYSAIARFQLYTGLSTLWIQENLFGNGKILPKVYIPNSLEFFYDKFDLYAPEYILNNHSVYKFYASFSSIEAKTETFKQLLKSEVRYNPAMHIGIPETNENRVHLRYCSECVKEDIAQVGVPYFHVSHNLQGVLLCHKHLTMLRYYPDQPGYTCLLEKNISYVILPKPMFYKVHIILAKLSYELIASDLDFNRKIVAEKIRTILSNRGFIISNGDIDQRQWAKYIQDYYDNDFLDSFEIQITDSPYCWAKRITRDNGQNIAPIQYLLVINLLSGSIKEFANVKQNYIKHKSRQRSLATIESNTLLNHKDTLTKAKTINPDWIRNDLKKNCGNAYFYVNKFDKHWIQVNMPAPVRKPRKDYPHKAYDEELDKQYLSLLMDAYDELLEATPIIPIKQYTLEKMIGRPLLLAKNKYPISLAFVNSVAENKEDFRYRKCKRVIDKFDEAGMIPTLHQVKVHAKIKEIAKFKAIENRIEFYIYEKETNPDNRKD